MPRLIRSWNELVGLKSENYVLEINVNIGCGWVLNRNTKEIASYLSTHTFYGSKHKFSTKLLNGYGFDVEIANWDDIPIE